MNRFLYSLIILLFIQVGLFAQTDSLGIKREGDKVFVLHKVQAKQTLYSLAKRYMTTVVKSQCRKPNAPIRIANWANAQNSLWW